MIALQNRQIVDIHIMPGEVDPNCVCMCACTCVYNNLKYCMCTLDITFMNSLKQIIKNLTVNK